MKRWIALEIQRKKLFLSIDYEQSLLFDEVRQANQKKKNIRGKKIDVCAPRGTLGVRRTLSKDSKLGKRAVLPPHGWMTFRAPHSQSSARRANINMFLTDFFCLVECPLKEARNIEQFGSPHLPISLNLCLEIHLFPASKKFKQTLIRVLSQSQCNI